MTLTTEDRLPGLTNALRNGQQCDEDGVMCIVSREACHVAADEIERLNVEAANLRAEVERLRDRDAKVREAVSDGEALLPENGGHEPEHDGDVAVDESRRDLLISIRAALGEGGA